VKHLNNVKKWLRNKNQANYRTKQKTKYGTDMDPMNWEKLIGPVAKQQATESNLLNKSIDRSFILYSGQKARFYFGVKKTIILFILSDVRKTLRVSRKHRQSPIYKIYLETASQHKIRKKARYLNGFFIRSKR